MRDAGGQFPSPPGVGLAGTGSDGEGHGKCAFRLSGRLVDRVEMSSLETLAIESAGPISTITINRPDKLNALDRRVLLELRQALLELSALGDTRAVILTGAGKAFVAGADIASMAEMTVSEGREFSELGHAVGAAIESAPYPVIAAVNGFALGGGCELALCCDFIYASSKAKFGQPEVNLGLMPGFGGTTRLPRRIGIARARELIYTGEMIRADEAYRIGLVNRVCEPDALLPEARKTAELIASKGPLAVAGSKRSILRGSDIELPTANSYETEAFSGLFGSTDQSEGTQAFLEKREAKFCGR